MDSFKDSLASQARDCGVTLTPEQLERFALYYRLLARENEKLNLTAITAPEEVIAKHFLDSLLIYDPDYFPPAARVCDVGCGAGFPGLPLKICHQDISLTLLDAVAKKLKFLAESIVLLGLDGAEICHSRAEDAGRLPGRRDSYDVVVARAVAALPVLCEYCLPLVRPGGVFVAMKARRGMDELAGARAAMDMLGGRLEAVKQPRLPGIDDVRVNFYVRKTRPTDARYPRKAGVPGKSPLI